MGDSNILDIDIDDFSDVGTLSSSTDEESDSNIGFTSRKNNKEDSDIQENLEEEMDKDLKEQFTLGGGSAEEESESSPNSISDNVVDENDEDMIDLSSPELNLESLIGSDEVQSEQTQSTEDILKPKDIYKYLIGFAVVAVAILVIWVFQDSEDTAETTLSTAISIPDSTVPITDTVTSNLQNIGVFNCDSLTYDGERVTDYLVIQKNVMTWDGSIYPYITGETTKGKINLKIFVTIESYNSLVNGQIITVEYNDLIFNDQHYATNISLGEVVGS